MGRPGEPGNGTGVMAPRTTPGDARDRPTRPHHGCRAAPSARPHQTAPDHPLSPPTSPVGPPGTSYLGGCVHAPDGRSGDFEQLVMGRSADFGPNGRVELRQLTRRRPSSPDSGRRSDPQARDLRPAACAHWPYSPRRPSSKLGRDRGRPCLAIPKAGSVRRRVPAGPPQH